MQEIINSIFAIESNQDFEDCAIQVFRHQFDQCTIYRQFAENLSMNNPSSITEIPFLPISFFKSHEIKSGDFDAELIFRSSGTGGDRSCHYVKDGLVYETSFLKAYRYFIGNPENQVFIALLPNYIEQGESSLVHMVDHLISLSQDANSGFLLNDLDQVQKIYDQSIAQGKEFVLIGVAYALLDLGELNINIPEAKIIETGGMKGRRKELSKEELHGILKTKLNTSSISSEYGMTELLSQAYSRKNGIFESPNWMKVMARQTNDPLSYLVDGRTGALNIIDLANIHSCSFIATDDLGKVNGNTFEILGRIDHSDIRGCNLLVQDT